MFDTEKLFSAKPRYSKSVRTEHPRVAFTMPSQTESTLFPWKIGV